jgi:Putative adhesin
MMPWTALVGALACAYQPDTTLALPARARVVVLDRDADVLVTGSTRADMRLQGTMPRGGCLTVEMNGTDVEVRVRRENAHDGTRAAITLAVREDVAVVVRITKGTIAIRDLRAPVEAFSQQAAIVAERLGATLRARSVQGDVTVHDVVESVTLRSTEGFVRMSGLAAGGTISTVSGRVEYVGTLPTTLNMESWSGALMVTGSHPRAGVSPAEVTANSYSGAITVNLTSNGEVDAGTISGTINSRLPVVSATLRRRRYLLGKGGARITVFSRTGTITVGSMP